MNPTDTPARRAVVTVIGEDRVGIVAGVSAVLAQHGINIEDIRMATMGDLFTMIALVSLDTMHGEFAAVLDRAQNAQKISLDGGQTWATTTPPPGPIAPARDLGLGWDIGENNYWFRGRIDDVALFNRALSAAQIGRIMQKGMTPELAQAPRPGTGPR